MGEGSPHGLSESLCSYLEAAGFLDNFFGNFGSLFASGARCGFSGLAQSAGRLEGCGLRA